MPGGQELEEPEAQPGGGQLYLGIDTSAYTTSLAALGGDGRLWWDGRRLLEVPPGARGLRQSEAVFQHLNRLPALFEEMAEALPAASVRAVGVSVRPRPASDSYMPVFRVGHAFARAVAAALGVPVVELTHQEGHIWAALWACELWPPHPARAGREAGGPVDLPPGAATAGERLVEGQRWVALHLSGGTTELLGVVAEAAPAPGSLGDGYGVRLRSEVLGGTSDLHAGQLVDRVGVALGLSFPCGPHLEALAAGATGQLRLPVPYRDGWVSFSGPATAAERLIASQAPAAEIARAVERCVAEAAIRLLQHGTEVWGARQALLVGGVAANTRIRAEVQAAMAERGVSCRVAPPALSTDNAVGVACGCLAACGA